MRRSLSSGRLRSKPEQSSFGGVAVPSVLVLKLAARLGTPKKYVTDGRVANNLAAEQGITRELGLSEVISKALEVYRRGFVWYFVLFLVAEVIYSLLLIPIQRAYVLPLAPVNATAQQLYAWVPGYIGTLVPFTVLTSVVSLVVVVPAYAVAIKMVSDEVQKGQVDLGSSLRFTAPRLAWVWALSVIFGVVVVFGLVALLVPGIIVAIMFCLALPVLMIEGRGVTECMSRSRELVGHRWMKTFVLFVIGVVLLGIASGVVGVVGGFFGGAGTLVSSALSAFYVPLIPITLAVYYYSNLARVMPPQGVQPPVVPSAVPQPGMKFCSNCGTQLVSSATFCSNCGSKQPE